ncbi:cupredoxin domain-containing protein [Candidatus Giovannonibacteria bacterium]|nr:cupredoxin domain-containing protein [Candidatus Giovannonibacteria bacterium]
MKTFIIILILVVLAGLGWYFYSQNMNYSGGFQNNSTPTPTPTPSAVNNEIVVKITSDGFSPSTLNIKAGDTVKFINDDAVKHWPASGPHPAHTLCPGFDSKPGINPGESYSFKFAERKTCPMHDHLKPTLTGKIVVE